MKDYDKNKKLYLKYWDINSFERVKVTCQFNESFIESCNEESDKGYFLSKRY